MERVTDSMMKPVGNDNLRILVGNIVDDSILSQGDAIVLPSNPMMRYGSGVSGAIFEKAGIDVLEEYAMRKYGISYEEGYKSILVPSLGTESYGFEHERVAQRVIKTINDYLDSLSSNTMVVNFVIKDEESATLYLNS